MICLDNMQTGDPENLAGLSREPRFSLVEQDVCDPIPATLAVDAIFNLACAASPPRYQADPVHTMMTSVVGTRHLLDHCERHGARFVQASTSEVYGDPKEHPQHEDYWGHVNPTGPRACYDEGKRAAETLCFDYLRGRSVDVRVARIFNTYGPRMRPDDGRIVSNLICQALAGEPLTIYGTGEQTRSFCYVDDLIRGAGEADGGDGDAGRAGQPRQSRRVHHRRAGRDGSRPDRHALAPRLRAAADRRPAAPAPEHRPRRKALLGWRPTAPLADGLPPTIAWFAGLREAVGEPARRAPAAVAALHGTA